MDKPTSEIATISDHHSWSQETCKNTYLTKLQWISELLIQQRSQKNPPQICSISSVKLLSYRQRYLEIGVWEEPQPVRSAAGKTLTDPRGS